MTSNRGTGNIGLRWDPRWDPADLPAIAKEAEELGFDELWTVEDCFSSGGMTSTAIALASTSSITIGIGLLPAIVRNPAITAMELAVLARTYPGRFVPTLGHGVEDWMLQIDARPPNRMTVLEETVTAVRSLLAGETVNTQGKHVKLSDVSLEHPPAKPPPVLIGTTGPRGLALAGRAADGFVIVEVSCPAAVRWARATAGPNPGHVVVYSYLSIDDDDAAGVAAIRPQIEAWMRSGDFPDMAEQAGIGRDGSGPLSDEMIRSMATAGSPESCRQTILGLWEAGADSVILLPRLGEGMEQMQRFAAEVLPGLKPQA